MTEEQAPFLSRHIGPRAEDTKKMLEALGFSSLDDFIKKVVPKTIQNMKGLDLPLGISEPAFLEKAKSISQKNKVYKSYIGMGYYDCFTPSVIQRNILENPSWYTAYTPYQSEISQGRLEALVNFQTVITELTGFEIANASLLDEGTAVAEAMSFVYQIKKQKQNKIVVDEALFPQSLEVLKTRCQPLNIEVLVGEKHLDEDCFAYVVQYPNAEGNVVDHKAVVDKAHEKGALVIAVCDLLSLTVLKPPKEWGADVAVGSAQRWGVPLGYGGPHGAYFATKEEYKRFVPGRIVGVSKDVKGKLAYRLALQTREQHIRRERATSNICTSQVLLAVMASMYAVYHGPQGLKNIALSIHQKTKQFYNFLKALKVKVENDSFFDTLTLNVDEEQKTKIKKLAEENGVNLNVFFENQIRISFDETKTEEDVKALMLLFKKVFQSDVDVDTFFDENKDLQIPKNLKRTSEFLKQPVFHQYQSETEMLRYMYRLEKKDLALNSAMIPLGSCTMKLNATSEMKPITSEYWSGLHPFCPKDQAQGYKEMMGELEHWLKVMTGYSAFSFQPNAGSQGEYLGLLAIRKYHDSQNQSHRKICLIPTSAHGTNPASAVMAGFEVVPVKCKDNGDVDTKDLEEKLQKHKEDLAAFMITYPSTHGVFEDNIQWICEKIHEYGGQVYLDGANFNALIGVSSVADLGCDVCHLNLHKTFCIPHGGGGPGVGPVGVREHLKPFLPKTELNSEEPFLISAAPYGSANILPISWGYCLMMGGKGLEEATKIAILNANYIAFRLKDHYSLLYTNKGYVAHECILDFREFKKWDITIEDVAKRLMDYGFHAPTMSWPVAGTLMIEPTESESLLEMDRFCEAMIEIRKEIEEASKDKNNVLKNAPHSIDVAVGEWDYPYSRTKALFPLPWVKDHKFWTPVSRVDNGFGDRNFMCTCPDLLSESV